jgi:hypothetical protein
VERRERLTNEGFLDRIRAVAGRAEEAVIADVEIDARGERLTVNITKTCRMTGLTLRSCVLPHTRFVSDCAIPLTLEEVHAPHLYLGEGWRSVRTRRLSIGKLVHNQKNEIALGGTFDEVELLGAEQVIWAGAIVRRLDIATSIGSFDVDPIAVEEARSRAPLVVTGLVKTRDPKIALAVRLLCPEAVIAYTGSIDAL